MAEKAEDRQVEDEAQIEQDAATEAEEEVNEEEAQAEEPAAPVANKRARTAQPCDQVTNAADVQAIVDAAVAAATEDLRGELAEAKTYIANQQKAERDAVVSAIVRNSSELEAADLEHMPLPTLRKLERQLAPPSWNFERPIVGNASGDVIEYEEAPMPEVDNG